MRCPSASCRSRAARSPRWPLGPSARRLRLGAEAGAGSAAEPRARAIVRRATASAPTSPPDLASLPDAEPRIEPIRSGGANKPYHGARPRLRADHPRQRLQRARPGLVVRQQVPRPPHRQRRDLRHVRDDRGASDPAAAELRADPQSRQRPRGAWCASTTAARSIAGRIVDLSYAAALAASTCCAASRRWSWSGSPSTRSAPAPGAAAAMPEATRLAARDAARRAAQRAANAAASCAGAGACARAVVAGGDAAGRARRGAAGSRPAAPSAVDRRPRPVGRRRPQRRAASGSQLGAFRESAGAESFQRRVGDEVEWLVPLLATFGDATLYRVQAGPYPSRAEAQERRGAGARGARPGAGRSSSGAEPRATGRSGAASAAAGDLEDRAGGVAGRVGEQQDDRLGDLFGRAGALHRQQRQHLRAPGRACRPRRGSRSR